MRVREASSIRLSPTVQEFLRNPKNSPLVHRFEELSRELMRNRELGVKIPRRLWPKTYVRQHGLRNLYKCDLGAKWRVLYTLIFEGAGISVVILDILTHKQYDNRFGYS